MKKFDATKMIGIIGTMLGIAGTLISSYANDKDLDRKVEEKVTKVLAEKMKN